MERNAGVFAANIDRLMTLHGMRNTALAKAVGVSRQMVSQWRQGISLPWPDRETAIAGALNCHVNELFAETEQETPPMLPIAQWARRENIPVGRAKSLFDLGILTGSTGGAIGEMHLVPVEARAPRNSKHAVRAARRPDWHATFAINFDCRMRLAAISSLAMGVYTGVGHCAVTHWRSGRGFPMTERLPLIAQHLNCTVEDLLREPDSEQITEWNRRYSRAAETDLAFAVNLDWRMRLAEMTNSSMSFLVDVAQNTVAHWRSGRGFPLDRLAVVAEQLGCTTEDLLRHPTKQQIKEWTFRYQRVTEDRAAA